MTDTDMTLHATADVPVRSTASITVSFGLINIPLSVYTATVETRTVRKEFTPEGHPVGRKLYNKETGADVEYADVVKMVEHDGLLVPLTDDEIAEATGHESGIAPIVGRVSLEALGAQFVTEKVYQLRPKSDKKVKTATDRAFTLLTETLAATNEAAMVRVSIRGAVARWGAITPDGLLRIVHSADQVRKMLPMPEVEVSATELDLARQLLGAIPAVDVSALRDDSSERVAEYVATKASAMVAGGEVAAPTKIVPMNTPVDLLAQLLASTEAAKEAKSSAA